METLSALLPICAGNSPVPGEIPAQRPVTRNFDVLICTWINGWVNNREAPDLRRNRAHYDVIVMWQEVVAVSPCNAKSTATAARLVPAKVSQSRVPVGFFTDMG